LSEPSAIGPSDAEIARINAEHLISTPLRPADLLFVFGTRHGVGETVDAAVDLWRRRFFRHAIVSGGMMPGDTRSECAVIKQGMVQGGVPAEVEKMLATINPFGTPVERWHTDPAFRARVLSEWWKIEPCKAQGFIADWP